MKLKWSSNRAAECQECNMLIPATSMRFTQGNLHYCSGCVEKIKAKESARNKSSKSQVSPLNIKRWWRWWCGPISTLSVLHRKFTKRDLCNKSITS